MKSFALVSIVCALGLAAGACGGDPDYLTTEELMKPESCMTCHPNHFKEWSGSMHAYAADDPVFLAMNRRGQAATNGALGNFCVTCHAPVALKLGLTTDGLNLATVPQFAKGVTCFFCHSVESITSDHNAPLVLATDDVIRGGVKDPVASPAHRSAYSTLLDGSSPESSPTCGSCHDVVTPAGVHLERTFSEWQTTIFAHPDPKQHLSCGSCHMFATDDVIAQDVPGVDVPSRTQGRHEHTFAGIDTALTTWPETDAQRAAITRDLSPAIAPKLCVTPENGDEIQYTLDNRGAGHMWPSGAAQDRRAWAEVVAYDAAGAVLFTSGAVADAQDPAELADANLWTLHDDVFDAQGQPAHFFWDVARYDTSRLLKPAVTVDRNDPGFYHSTTHVYPIPALRSQIARVTARLRIRPLPLVMLRDLIAGGELDAAVLAALPTTDVEGTKVEWTPGAVTPGNPCLP